MVGYMDDTTGPTRDAGWEVGVRTTVPAPLAAVWDHLLGEGLPLWLGDLDALPLERGDAYETRDGIRGTVRSRTEYLRVRVGWRPADLDHETILQLTVREAATGTTIGFHHERLADRDERKAMLGRWKAVAAQLRARFSAASS